MKKFLIVICSLIVLALSGCFDIKEEIFLEKNGSGTYTTTMDMSKLKDMMNMIKMMMPDSLKDSTSGFDKINELDSLQNMWQGLESLKGISQVKREKKADMVFQVSFRFTDINALNLAMTKRNKNDSVQIQSGDFFSFRPGEFSCNDTSLGGLGQLTQGMNGGGESGDSLAASLDMMKAFLGDMKYTTIYHFPGKVTSYSNKEARLSDDNKTLTLELNLSDSKTPHTLLNKIQYQK